MGLGETSEKVLHYLRIYVFGIRKKYKISFKEDKCTASVKFTMRRTLHQWECFKSFPNWQISYQCIEVLCQHSVRYYIYSFFNVESN